MSINDQSKELNEIDLSSFQLNQEQKPLTAEKDCGRSAILIKETYGGFE